MNDSIKTKSKSLTFSDFTLEQIVIELRFPFAFLFWDQAGILWQTLREKLPPKSFVLNDASPSSVSVAYAGIYEIIAESNRLVVTCVDSAVSIKEFLEILNIVFDEIAAKMGIDNFLRIGLRQLFTKKFSSNEKSIEALLSLPSVKIPDKLIDNNPEVTINPGIVIRIEDGKKGILFNLRTGSRNFDISIPNVFKVEKESNRHQSYQDFFVMFDIDAYTNIQIPVGQLSITDWTKQAIETVKRDAAKFF